MTPAEIVGQRIRFLRESHLHTQAWLAERCMVTQMQVSRWERGECVPGVARRHLIAGALNIAPAALFREIDAAEQAA